MAKFDTLLFSVDKKMDHSLKADEMSEVFCAFDQTS